MRNRRTSAFRQKMYLLTGVVTVAALVAMITVYQRIGDGDSGKSQEQITELTDESQNGTDSDNQLADADIDAGPGSGVEYDSYDYEDWTDVADGSSGSNGSTGTGSGTTTDGKNTLTADESQLAAGEDGSGTTGTADGAELASAADGTSQETQAVFSAKSDLTFSQESKISWPVQGNVLMAYSMDKTIYFATLDQYKYNPAIVVQANVNTKVLAGVKSVIADISTNENTGLTVTVDLGSGYQAIYGQLKEVKKKVGDTLTPEDVLGYVAEPTKYYSVEGSNLYFAMTKDGTPVNPMAYLN